MILVAGGTGLLGRHVVARLVDRRLPVRVLTRDARHGRAALGALADQVDIVVGDVREPATLAAAVGGADTVVAAVQGFGGREAGGIAAVDRDGNRNLIAASARTGVRRFVLLSIHDASPTDQLRLARAKADIEAALRATAMTPVVIRPTAYMETWAGIVGDQIMASGRPRVFGRGRNAINFVAAVDVAAVVDEAVAGRDLDGRTVEVVGPENLSFDEVVGRFAEALGRPVPMAHVPVAILRVMSVALRAFKPVLADQVAAAVVLDTTDRTARTAAPPSGTTRVGTTTFTAVIHAMVARGADPGS